MEEKKCGRYCEWTRREFLRNVGIMAGFSAFSSSLAPFLLHPDISAPKRGKMEKRRLGRTGLDVSVISFGGGVIGAPHIPDVLMETVVRTAIDLGVNFLDTAPIYGYSEVRIGKAIKKYPRELVFLATKVESESHQWLREEAEQLIRQSLFWMGVPYIDLVQFHGVGRQEALEKILSRGGALDGVKSAQK
ncbi:MAG: aldo/keto reductase, partial [bacterium]